MATLAREGFGSDPQVVAQNALQGEAAHLARIRENHAEARELVQNNTSGSQDLRGMFSRLGAFLTTDQQLDDSIDLATVGLEQSLASLGPDGRYLPPPPGTVDPADLAGGKSWLDAIYKSPLDFRFPYRVIRKAAAETQICRDFTRLGAGLELWRRQTGGYPPNLAELGPVMPGGPPNSPATGAAYGYEITPDGYRLSSPGIPGKNAEPSENIQWEVSKPRPAGQ